ncbi:MAG: hypothetical protein WA709_36515 [Stellaceae bacterium]
MRQRRVPSIGAVQAVHVATWIEAGTRELATPSFVSPQSVICSTGSSPAKSCRSIRRARYARPGYRLGLELDSQRQGSVLGVVEQFLRGLLCELLWRQLAIGMIEDHAIRLPAT